MESKLTSNVTDQNVVKLTDNSELGGQKRKNQINDDLPSVNNSNIIDNTNKQSNNNIEQQAVNRTEEKISSEGEPPDLGIPKKQMK